MGPTERNPQEDSALTSIRRAAVAALAATAALLASTSAAQAMNWTALDSTTTEEIAAVDYHPNGTIWFATKSGKIFTRNPAGAVSQDFSDAGRQFYDIAFRPAGDVGLATADTGHLYRSLNGGDTWTPVDLTNDSYGEPCTGNPAAVSTPSDNLLAVEWSSDDVAWVVSAARGQILKSTNGGVSWVERGRMNDGECRIEADVTDVAPIPGSVDDVYFVDDDFATLWRTSDGLLSNAAERSELVNCFGIVMKLAVDPASPNRVSAAGPCTGSLHWGFSSDSGTTKEYVDSLSSARIRDVDAGAGVFLAVGDAGTIEQTFDGSRVYAQPDNGPFATRDWRAVDFADASRAVVAGLGGALAITDQANVPPPTPGGPTPPAPGPDTTAPSAPSGLTIGSRTLIPGQGTTFGFNAGEAGLATLTFEKRFAGLKGKRKGKRVCLPKTKRRLGALRRQTGGGKAFARALRQKACQGYQRIGSIRQQARAGRNVFAFNGRVAGRKLTKGNYRAKLTITDSAGNTSRAETLRFKVVGKKRR